MLSKTPTSLTFRQSDLKDALARVKLAISTEETRYYLNGVYVHGDKKAVHFVATDGYRLAHALIKSDDPVPQFAPVILPRQFVLDALKALKHKNHWRPATLEIAVDKVCLLPWEQEAIQAKPVDGTYPDYVRVVPRGDAPNGVWNINAEAFEHAVKSLTAYYGDSRTGLRLRITDDRKLVISVTPDPALGCNVKFTEATATIENIGIQADPTQKAVPEVGFDGRYLCDIVRAERAQGTTLLQFRYYDQGGPAFFSDGSQDDNYAVLMPKRV